METLNYFTRRSTNIYIRLHVLVWHRSYPLCNSRPDETPCCLLRRYPNSFKSPLNKQQVPVRMRTGKLSNRHRTSVCYPAQFNPSPHKKGLKLTGSHSTSKSIKLCTIKLGSEQRLDASQRCWETQPALDSNKTSARLTDLYVTIGVTEMKSISSGFHEERILRAQLRDSSVNLDC